MLQPQHLDAFDTPPSFTATRRESELRRDLGIARAELRQERLDPDWTAAAAGFLRDFAKDTALGQPFLIEDAREQATAAANAGDAQPIKTSLPGTPAPATAAAPADPVAPKLAPRVLDARTAYLLDSILTLVDDILSGLLGKPVGSGRSTVKFLSRA